MARNYKVPPRVRAAAERRLHFCEGRGIPVIMYELRGCIYVLTYPGRASEEATLHRFSKEGERHTSMMPGSAWSPMEAI